jgi:hypothetical protein
MTALERINEGWVIRAGVVVMFAVLGLLAGLSLVTQRRTTDLAERAEAASSGAASARSLARAPTASHSRRPPASPRRSGCARVTSSCARPTSR